MDTSEQPNPAGAHQVEAPPAARPPRPWRWYLSVITIYALVGGSIWLFHTAGLPVSSEIVATYIGGGVGAGSAILSLPT